LNSIERAGISLAPLSYGVGEHDADPGRNHRMMRAAEEPRGRVSGFGLQELVEARLVHAPL